MGISNQLNENIAKPVERVVNIRGLDYVLKPKAHQECEHFFEITEQYQLLDEQAKMHFNRKKKCQDTSLNSDHLIILPKQLPQELCQNLIKEFINDPKNIDSPEILNLLLSQVVTPEFDQQIISYFNSEYSVLWWSVYEVNESMKNEGYFTRWHCDNGPKKHLKAIIYLNGYEEHDSDTAYLDQKATDELKDVGYIFNNIDDRVDDITELCQHFDINFTPKYVQANTGDCLIFNPNKVAHKAVVPRANKTRYALNFCFVQSVVHWKETMERYFIAPFGTVNFRDYAKSALSLINKPVEDLSYTFIPLDHKISSLAHVEFLLENIFSEIEIAQEIFTYLVEQDPDLSQCCTVFDFIRLCKKHLQDKLNKSAVLNKKVIAGLMDLARYEEEFKDSCNRYSSVNKAGLDGMFWPDPTHPKRPASKFQQLPFVNKHPIMDLSTPIGSAGSCFAFEIAKYFQQEGYNYVITERNDDVDTGVLIDGYAAGDEIAKFCANYGILFNAPSFTQLAEKAFGLRQFSKLVIESEQGGYVDPYRENVFFKSPSAYLNDYEKHIAAVKEAFLHCEVFVVTLGLNECWQLKDGTVMSRNPRLNMYHLVKHRTLTVAENIKYIQRFFDIIKQHNPEFKLVISVSPIPFLATGRAHEQHIISANCHSKSVLRVAADELVANNEDMYYLPSYELVTECVEDAWDDDCRHVKPETVAKVVDMFKQIFVK